MSWLESVWFIDELLTDSSSHLLATAAEWEFPASREWMLLADLRDFTLSRNKRNKPMQRPWERKDRRGKTDLSPADARAALARNAGRG